VMQTEEHRKLKSDQMKIIWSERKKGK